MKNVHWFQWMVAASVVMSTAGLSQAQDSHAGHAHHQQGEHQSAPKGPNGGTLQQVGNYRVETVVQPRGVVCILYDAQGKLVPASTATGNVRLSIGENPKTYDFALAPLQNGAIGAGIDLSKVVGHPLHMDVTIEGIDSTPLQFHTMAQLSGVSDALLISLQKTCPVTGKPLGSMGAPPKIQVGGKPLFVCCAGCSAKVRANPQPYLAKYYGTPGKEVRPGVVEATLADAEAIAAQKSCPVMDEPLGGMGAPMKVNVNGKAVYICCAGCAKKLAAEPDKYLGKLAAQGVQPPNF